MRHALLAAGMTALFAAMPASAQTGAPVAAATQPGSWGANGWQPGAPRAAAVPGFTQAAPVPTQTAAPAYGAPVPEKVYDRIERGRKVKGPALANTVTEYAPWGLPQPGPGMRWIRYYDDAVLLDADNRAVDVRSVTWDASHRAPQGYAGGGYPAYPQPAYRAPGTYVERHGNTTVTTQILPPPAFVGGGYGPYGQVVSVVPGTVTTTTTTYWRTVRRGPSRYRHAVRRSCVCGS